MSRRNRLARQKDALVPLEAPVMILCTRESCDWVRRLLEEWGLNLLAWM